MEMDSNFSYRTTKATGFTCWWRDASDTQLEGDGFELLVPKQIRFRFRESSAVSHDGLTVS
jgi:hypothetical protein